MSDRSDPKDWIACGPRGAASLERAVDEITRWAGEYLASLEERPVRDDAARWGDVLDRIGAHPPERGIGPDALGALVDETDRVVTDRLVHWQSPRFFAYFPCSNSVPAIAAELMSAVVNVNGMLWSTSPACTELEVRMMDWCAEMLGIDDAFTFERSERGGGCIQGTASEATLAALCAARRRCTSRGVDRSKVCVYASDQAHSSVVKAAMVAGLADDADDRSRVRLIRTDDAQRMDPRALAHAIERDLSAGLVPAMVALTAGTTSTGAVDPTREVLGVLESRARTRPWIHIDAAWAGAACVCPEHRWVLDAHEHADSVCINPHKWLLTNFDCDLFWVRDRDALTESMSITPAYLRDGSGAETVDYRDWHVPLGRRMRALKLWFVIRCFGVAGLRDSIEGHIALARRVEAWVRETEGVEMVGERALGLVCFRLGAGDDATRRLVERVNARGRVMITGSEVPIGPGGANRAIARVSVGTPGVDDGAVDTLLDELNAAAGAPVE